MKKVFIIIALALLLFMLGGCKAKQKMEDKLAEKVMESALGADVDIDGEEVTFKGENGDVTLGSGEWPDSEIAQKIPEFKDGKITSAINSEGYVFIIMEEVKENDFKVYYEAIKSDFAEESYESKFEDIIAYSGKDSDGLTMIISYTISEKTLSIQAAASEKEE